MIKKITKRYNKKLTHEFKRMRVGDLFEDLKPHYQSGINAHKQHKREECEKIAIAFDNNKNKWKKYASQVPIVFHPK